MIKQGSSELLQQDSSTAGKNTDEYSDKYIIARVIEGHTGLYEIIVRRYNQRLFRIIRSYLNDENDVKDVMQSAYLKAFENLEQFRAESRFSTWLIRIAINEALKKINEQGSISESKTVTIVGNGDQNNRIETSTPESEMIRDDINKHLEKAIDALPQKYRSVLIMREIEQMSTRETASALNISRVNVKVRLYRAKKMLRDNLEQMLDKMDLYSFKGGDCDAMTRRVMKNVNSRSQDQS